MKFKEKLENEGLSKNTVNTYVYHVFKFLNEQGTTEVTVEVLRRYLFTIAERYKPSTVRIIMNSLDKYSKFLGIKWGDEINKRNLVKDQVIFRDVLSSSEVNKIVKTEVEKRKFNRERNSLMLIFLYQSGVRVSELVNIRYEDIHQDYITIKGKGDKWRNILVKPSLVKRIKAFANIGYLFTNTHNEQLTPRTINKIINNRVSKTGIDKRVSAHTFRRSFCTNLIKSGANIKIVSLLMGHANIETTARYMHFTKQDIKTEYLKYI